VTDTRIHEKQPINKCCLLASGSRKNTFAHQPSVRNGLDCCSNLYKDTSLNMKLET